MHKNGYFYMLRNQTLTNNKNDEMKRDKKEIQRLTRALKGRSLRIKVDFRASDCDFRAWDHVRWIGRVLNPQGPYCQLKPL